MEILKHNPLQNIIQRIDGEDTANFLSNEIQGSDFHSMMLHVYDKRSDRLVSADIYRQYAENRFVKPATVDQRDIVRFDTLFLDIAPQEYVAVELSPTQPFAVNKVLAHTDQKLVISSVRNTEVSADITTALALESAVRRQALIDKDHLDRTMIKLCSCHRCVRAQQFDDGQGFTSHFRVVGMLSSYRRGQNSFGYEMEQFSEHIDTYLNLMYRSREIGCRFQSISVNLSDIRLMEDLITTFGLDRDFLRRNTQNQAVSPFIDITL